MTVTAPSQPEPEPVGSTPLVLALEDARDVDVVGGKAAALSAAARSGLPVLPGFVLDLSVRCSLPGHPWIAVAKGHVGGVRRWRRRDLTVAFQRMQVPR